MKEASNAQTSLSSEIFRRFGTGSSRSEILKGPVSEGFPDRSHKHQRIMSEKGMTVHNDVNGTGQMKKGGKIRRHCARWWWVHLIIFICIIVLVVCLIIFVAIPRIAQSRVNGAQLSIESIVVSQTQSDNYTMAVNSTIRADDSVHATLDPFEGVLYLEDWSPQTPFARLGFPQTTSAETSVVNITQFTAITDMNAFTVFNTWLLVNDTLRLTVRGNTQLRVSGISRKYPVEFKKTLTLTGLGNFNGTTVSDTVISLEPDENGNNFKGTATIPNRSILTFEIGNATFFNYLNGSDIGTVFINNMTLRPGLNPFPMAANISQAPVLSAITQRPYCDTGVLPFELRGKNVVNHGQRLSYYADSLGSTNQSVPIDVKTPLGTLGLPITCS